jgi:xylulose-5-phosphate/fructose-6-phosphate phosphoketolase
VIVLRTPKGWIGPKVVDGLWVESTFRHVRGYKEEGTTTTPFDMAVLNDIDRFHLVGDVIDHVPQLGDKAAYFRQAIRDKLIEHKQYIRQYG